MANQPSNAVQTQVLSNEDITAKLRALGAVEEGYTQTVNRVEWKDQLFTLGDETYLSNPKTGTPAMRIRILNAPIELQAFFFEKDGIDANVVGRPEIAGKFCKSFFSKPSQARKYAEDGTPCGTCPVNPFTKNSPAVQGRKCSWRGELSFQVLDAQGSISDETVWTLTLPTTAMIEFKGIAKDPARGHVSEHNFMHQLAIFATEGLTDNEADAALFRAWTGLTIGNVIADVYAVPTSSKDGGRKYSCVSLRPVQILDDLPPAPAVGSGDPSGDLDDLPF